MPLLARIGRRGHAVLLVLVGALAGGGALQRAKGSGGATGKVKFNDFHFTMKVNKASPKLFK